MADLIDNIQQFQRDLPPIKDAKISTPHDLKDKSNEVSPELERLRETHRHEIDMIKYGWFGKMFGSEENSSKALTFTLTLLILCFWLIIVIASIWVTDLAERASDFFKVIIPVITLAFGYFFGKK